MNLLQLEYFQTVARLEHMTKAAQELRVSQPSLSNTITRLEGSIGVPLFYREGRQIRLSPYGRAFLKRVNQILFELEKGKLELEEMAGGEKGVISLAVTLPSALPVLLKEFLSRYPNARFIQRQALSKKEIISQLSNHDVDICLSTFPIIHPDIEWMPLFNDEIFLSVPPNHHLANRKSIKLSEAANEPFISISPEYYFRELTTEFCRQAGFEPNITFEISEAGIVQGLVEQNLGVTFTPMSLSRFTKLDSVQLHIEDPVCKRVIGLAWYKGTFLSYTVKKFIEFCEYFFKEEI